MHIEILTEDSSGRRLLEHLMPKLIGPHGESHTWRLHAYRGIGRSPAHLSPASDPSRRILLDQLPRCCADTSGLPASMPSSWCSTPMTVTARPSCPSYGPSPHPAMGLIWCCSASQSRRRRLGILAIALPCFAPTRRRGRGSWMTILRIPCAAPGNFWQKRFIRVASAPFSTPDGPCPARSSMSGQNGSAHCSIQQATCRRALPGFGRE